MPKTKPQKTVLAQAKVWAARNKLFGPQAFLRYVILNFVDLLNQTSNDFIFKGGNLLWIYLGTPRSTIDLDLATIHSRSDEAVRAALEEACHSSDLIQYRIINFREVTQEDKRGAAVAVGFKTKEGATNRFEIDIVYNLETDVHEITSSVHPENRIKSATLENIIADKLAACHRYGSGNSRMKDFDDLWRIARARPELNSKKLRKLLQARKTNGKLLPDWINSGMERSWTAHQARYRDLPSDLAATFTDINEWLSEHKIGDKD